MSFLDNIFRKKNRGSWENKSPLQSPISPFPETPIKEKQPYKIGYKIAGLYEIYRILGGEGKSGMGIVYVCYDHESENIYALKTFQDKYLQDKNKKDLFKKEALAWIHLEQHPYIVKAEWVQEYDNRLFVVSEFIAPDEQGRNTLAHYLYSPITLKQALTWGIQFCRGMEYACSKGVSPHRDIKPDNIMITQDGTMKITDFGLAKLWEGAKADPELAREMTGEGKGLTLLCNEQGKVICGTPPYMAPEQFDGKADVRSDIYSFGLMLYQIFDNGKLPFYPRCGDSWEKVHKSYPVSSLITESVAISKVAEVIGRCLTKESISRYRDFREVRNELERIYEQEIGEKVPAPPDKIALDAGEHSNKGISFAALGLHDEAISEYKRALLINPNDSIALNNLGNALKAKGLLDEAISEFRAALQINPKLPVAHVSLGDALAKKGLLDEAIEEYREALKINPRLAVACSNLGTTFLNQGLLDEAIGKFNEALKIEPNCAETHINLGVAYEKKGLFDEAIAEYKAALKKKPEHEGAHNNLGLVLYKMENFDEAIREFKETLNINPQNSLAHDNLGLVFYKKGLIDDAIQEHRKALLIDPDDAEAMFNMGNALYHKGCIDEAIKEYREALRLDSEHVNAHYNLAAALIDKNLIDEAIVEYRKVLKINPQNLTALSDLGMALTSKGQIDEAIIAFESFMQYAPPQYSEAVNTVKKIIKDLKGRG